MSENKEKAPPAPKQAAAPANTATPVRNQPPRVLKIPRTFELFIEEMNEMDDGSVQWRPVNMGHENGRPVTVTVNSPKELEELRNQYKMVGQRFTIVREINKPTPQDIQRMAKEQGIDIPPPPQQIQQAVQPPAQFPVQ